MSSCCEHPDSVAQIERGDGLCWNASPEGQPEYVDKFHWNIADYAVRSTVYARGTLLAGFTTVRNVGDHANESVALRNAINAGIIPGPRIYTAGRAMGTTSGHADHTNRYRTDPDLAGDPGPAEGIINSHHHRGRFRATFREI